MTGIRFYVDGKEVDMTGHRVRFRVELNRGNRGRFYPAMFPKGTPVTVVWPDGYRTVFRVVDRLPK